jgi:hypothetical protein
VDVITATPAQIDTEIARLQSEITQSYTAIQQAQVTLDRIADAADYEKHFSWNSPQAQAAAEQTIKDASANVDRLTAQIAPLYDRYEGERWNRYYLVTNTGGHVHTSMDCDTCYDTTQFAWLTEYSGMSHEDLTALAGEMSCAVCFPNLPAEIMAKKTRIEDPAKRKSRQEREAKKAEREAKRLEKALLPDGSTLTIVAGGYRKRFETLHSARGWLTDAHWWGVGDHPSFPKDAVTTVAEAVAAKEGKDVKTVLDEAATRAAKRK